MPPPLIPGRPLTAAEKQDRRRAKLAAAGLKLHQVVVPIARVPELEQYAAALCAETESGPAPKNPD